MGSLEVSILGASDLMMIKGKPPNAYARLRIEGQKRKTKVMKKQADPVWDDTYTYTVSESSSVITIHVLHRELFGKTIIAQLSLPLRDVIKSPDHKLDAWLPLEPPTLLLEGSEWRNSRIHIIVKFTDYVKSTITLDDFDLLATIGAGAFGKVMQVKLKSSGQVYAMKLMKKRHILEKGIVKYSFIERNTLQKMQHPFLNQLVYSFQTDEHVVLVTNYLNGGDLFFHLNQQGVFSEDTARFYAAELVLAFEYLHDRTIVYRDLKPENVLLDKKGHVCLTDFGFCKEEVVSDSATMTICGTPNYMAPEMLLKKGYGNSIDWWSLGVLIYEMLTGGHPFAADNHMKTYQLIVKEEPFIPPYLSKNVQDLLSQLLTKDPTQRLGYNGAGDIKNHPWFSGLKWDAIFNKQIKPPLNPKVKGDQDTRNMDPRALMRTLRVTRSNEEFSAEETAKFEGYEYAPRSKFASVDLPQPTSPLWGRTPASSCADPDGDAAGIGTGTGTGNGSSPKGGEGAVGSTGEGTATTTSATTTTTTTTTTTSTTTGEGDGGSAGGSELLGVTSDDPVREAE